MNAASHARWMMAGLMAMAAPVLAQQSAPKFTWLLGGEAVVFRSAHPRGGTAGLGGTIGVDRAVGRFITLRAQVRGMRMIATADDISLCTPLPDGGCWPDPVFPDQIWDVQAGALVRLWGAPRVWAVLGLGATSFLGARERERNAALRDRRSRWRAEWLGGVELALGSSPRAPRVQITQSTHNRPVLDLTALSAVALLLPF